MYHRVADIPVDPWGLAVHPVRFEKQITRLKRSRRVVHLHELLDLERSRTPSEKPLAAVTFDDGYHDVYLNARPILQRLDCPMTLFVTTEIIGTAREFWWDALARVLLEAEYLPDSLTLHVGGKDCHWRVPPFSNLQGRDRVFREIWGALRVLPHQAQRQLLTKIGIWSSCDLSAREMHRAMTAQEVRNISDDLITIGAHTLTHPTLPAHSADIQFREIADSRRACEEITGTAVRAFAYPFGDHSDVTVRAVREAGFELACTVDARSVGHNPVPLTLPRIYVGNWEADEFQMRIEDPSL
ncbi:polysaccharide deacetylase family protein [Bradyrhizobium sp. NBAIM20]|uniref:polysaccharide deacetylase family protein n=1 Tax=unclassified Bradyrhizobium TaxID=2631580 RepID=UPI001CD6F196|nr:MULTISPECIES: polysaccharide deacetylase family protein [unclassified Bradyrhizobium]MCA1414683.1 polysaccharide deacetylase family protein [Bradyrhizobium sp. NBAIM20]MCA1461872.1 polysaccharide deacetylase family protein [Bradyrhizobium sp. NBAIM18]